MCCAVRQCCFCIGLRAGVIAIACLALLGDGLLLAWSSYVTHLMMMDLHRMLDLGYEYRDAEDLIPIGLTLYFWTVVRSYYLELDGGGGARSTAGRVYHTVPPGGVFPAHDTYGDDEGGFAMQASAPPLYPSYTQEPPRPYLCAATAHGVTR